MSRRASHSNTPKTRAARKRSGRNYKSHARKNRPLHRRFMLHPITVLFLLCAGVLLAGLTFKTSAISYSVHGSLPAVPLTTGAVITSPKNGSTVSSANLLISGTCPANSYVKVTINGTFGGAAWCVKGRFQIHVSLFPGKNVLTVRDYNVTDSPGPATPGIIVYYNPPASSGSGGVSTSGGRSGAPLLLLTDFHYQTFLVGKAFTWSVQIKGGVSPFDLKVDWGDGQTADDTYYSDQTISLQHTYSASGYYPIIVRATDASRYQRILELAGLIKNPGANAVPAGGSTQTPAGAPQSFWQKWLWVAWPVFATLVLMVISFWLGEQEVYFRLRRKFGNNGQIISPR